MERDFEMKDEHNHSLQYSKSQTISERTEALWKTLERLNFSNQRTKGKRLACV